MTSTDTLLRLHCLCTRQAQPDGVVFPSSGGDIVCSVRRHMVAGGSALETPTHVLHAQYHVNNSPPLEGWQAQPDGVVCGILRKIPEVSR